MPRTSWQWSDHEVVLGIGEDYSLPIFGTVTPPDLWAAAIATHMMQRPIALMSPDSMGPIMCRMTPLGEAALLRLIS